MSLLYEQSCVFYEIFCEVSIAESTITVTWCIKYVLFYLIGFLTNFVDTLF